MPDEFLFDYILLVFFSAIGVVQVAAARSRLAGLMFLRQWPRATQGLGSVLVIVAFIWYSTNEFRNIPDSAGGIDGNTQALWFSLSAGAGVAMTFLVSSAINHAWAGNQSPAPTGGSETPTGITQLERTTVVRALAAQARRRLGDGL
jgi:hypothetical protein